MEEWTEAIDNNLQVDTVYLDFRKAFDSVTHKILLQKLDGYNIKYKGSIIKMIGKLFDQKTAKTID